MTEIINIVKQEYMIMQLNWIGCVIVYVKVEDLKQVLFSVVTAVN